MYVFLHLQTFVECPERLPENYVVYCTPIPGDENCNSPYTSNLLEVNNSQLLLVESDNEDLRPNCLYITIIETINKAGKSNSTGHLNISKLSLIIMYHCIN